MLHQGGLHCTNTQRFIILTALFYIWRICLYKLMMVRSRYCGVLSPAAAISSMLGDFCIIASPAPGGCGVFVTSDQFSNRSSEASLFLTVPSALQWDISRLIVGLSKSCPSLCCFHLNLSSFIVLTGKHIQLREFLQPPYASIWLLNATFSHVLWCVFLN